MTVKHNSAQALVVCLVHDAASDMLGPALIKLCEFLIQLSTEGTLTAAQRVREQRVDCRLGEHAQEHMRSEHVPVRC